MFQTPLILSCLAFVPTVERLSTANETMELPPKKEEKKVRFYDVLVA